MSKPNPLAGLIGYGDSDEESDDAVDTTVTLPARNNPVNSVNLYSSSVQHSSASIHPPPITHCPWSACYDETSGFTYYWNHLTNAVTWEAPPEYLLALKLAQQQLATGSTEVSAAEWQLYQQALADKVKGKATPKLPIARQEKKETVAITKLSKNKRKTVNSEDDEKIELITSYSNTDSESESESPAKNSQSAVIPKPVMPSIKPTKIGKVASKKKKIETVEYGPSLPRNQSYVTPIGPELPPELMQSNNSSTENKPVKPPKSENEEDQDETALFEKLKDKAKLLEKLGGELPKDVKNIIKQTNNTTTAQVIEENSRTSSIDTNIDELLDEIEKKELPKAKKQKIEIDSPKSGTMTPEPEMKALFPSGKTIIDEPTTLFNNTTSIQNGDLDKKELETLPLVAEKKGANLYIMDSNEPVENISKRKLRISNSVLPDRPKSEVPSYTTKYSQHIEGFSSERTGLGFSNDDTEETSKSAISYGNGLMFTKGETLNEQTSKEDDLEDMMELLGLKLKHLNELQPNTVTPIQELYIQLQTLLSAHAAGAVCPRWLRRWLRAAHEQLRAREQRAPPPGWTAIFCRSEVRYRYRRDADGLEQWEFPAESSTDMDICDTPPHPGFEDEMPVMGVETSSKTSPEPPPPPAWSEPPPPGEQPFAINEPAKPQLDELASFYNEIAEFESEPKPPTPEPPLLTETAKSTELPRELVKRPELPREPKRVVEDRKSVEKETVKDGKVKKKTKVKISTSMGMKHKTVSTLVAKWQQVADEIHSD